MKYEVKTVNVTPTWEALMPLILDQLQSGKNVPLWTEELLKLARAMDGNNALSAEPDEPTTLLVERGQEELSLIEDSDL